MSTNKRFFAFGCSFTNYIWPTWADLIGHNFGSNYFNYGRPGAGNVFIFNSIIEANQIHRFTKDDLIIIQWSSTDREDRYINNKWVTPGCLINYQTDDYIKKYYSFKGFLIRDLATITSVVYMLKSIGCDYKFLTLNNLKKPVRSYFDGDDIDEMRDILVYYRDILELMPPSFNEILEFSDKLPLNIDDILFEDIHPTPIEHYNYLHKVSPEYAVDCKELANDYTQQLFELIKKYYKHNWQAELWNTRRHWPQLENNFMRISQKL